MKKQFQVKCPAKINLSLDVLSRRDDGYHNLSMIMQEVNLFDTIIFELSEGHEVFLASNDPDVPTDDRNLIVKATKLFFEETKLQASAKIYLDKKIPSGAGLGGGSSDAAGTLKALNNAFGNPISVDKLALMSKQLGADVPFFLYGGCMLAEGIGEILTPLPSLKNVHILLAKPPVFVSTAYVFKNLSLDNIKAHPDTKKVIEALRQSDLDLLAASCKNVLETVTAKEYPQIEEYKRIMIDMGAAYSLMSGSGSTVFGVFKDLSSANAAYEKFKTLTKDVYIV